VNEYRIQRALAIWINYRRHLCLPNVNGGLGLWSRGEMDFIAITGVGYIIEVEIKCTLADLRREWRSQMKIHKHKRAHAVDKGIRRFFICTPQKISQQARLEIEAEPLLSYAGILSVHDEANYVKVVRPAQNLKSARKLSPDEYLKIGHLATMRFWERGHLEPPAPGDGRGYLTDCDMK
jgi:hypothetical protein